MMGREVFPYGNRKEYVHRNRQADGLGYFVTVPKQRQKEKNMEKDTKKNVKSRIVSAAWQLFYEKGYNGTTVDDIIELSGTSKGSFYYYFSTKDELLNTLSLILDDYYEELEKRWILR